MAAQFKDFRFRLLRSGSVHTSTSFAQDLHQIRQFCSMLFQGKLHGNFSGKATYVSQHPMILRLFASNVGTLYHRRVLRARPRLRFTGFDVGRLRKRYRKKKRKLSTEAASALCGDFLAGCGELASDADAPAVSRGLGPLGLACVLLMFFLRNAVRE